MRLQTCRALATLVPVLSLESEAADLMAAWDCNQVTKGVLVVQSWIDNARIQRHDGPRLSLPRQPEPVASCRVLDTRGCDLHRKAKPPLAHPGGQHAELDAGLE